MASAVLVVFKYGDDKALSSFSIFDSFKSIQIFALERWPELEKLAVTYFYTIGAHSRCKMVSEADFATISWLLGRDAIFDLEISIHHEVSLCASDCAASSSTTVQPIIPYVATVNEPANVSVEQLFLQHTEKKLRSSEWAGSIKFSGQMFFGGIPEFRVVLAKYACEHGFGFVYSHNNSRQIGAYCKKRKETGCRWYVYASVQKSNNMLYVRSFIETHTCGAPEKSMKNHRLSSDVVKSVILDEIKRQPETNSKAVVKLLKSSYGYVISRKVAYTAVLKAKECIVGDAGQSYNLIKAYFDKLKKCDPSSQVLLEFDPQTRAFQRCHVAFGACLAGFSACRPLLFLDGTFLKNKYKGHLLVATGKDANKGLFPVAFSVVQSEDADNWLRFLTFLCPHISGRDLTFVSDRHGGIGQAISSVFPNSHHAFCMRHLKQNLKHKFRYGKGFKELMLILLDKCAYAPTVEMFDKCVEEFKMTGGQQAVQFLENLPKEHYANAYFKGNRYGEMTSNAAESFNNQIKEERELPITDLINNIRNMLMVQMCSRSDKAKKCTTILSPHSKYRYDKRFDYCRSWTVKPSNSHVFQVESDPIMIVDIENHTCSCFGWQLKSFPCSHAVAALEFACPDTKFQYIDEYFYASKFRESYALSIPALSTYQDPEPVQGELSVLPPICKKQPGRPRKKRIPSNGELAKAKRRCSRCNEMAFHNRTTCDKAL